MSIEEKRQTFEAELKNRAKGAEELLLRYLPEPPEAECAEATVLEAMRYSVRAGGKRLRPVMLLESFRLFGGNQEEQEIADAFAAALELIHTYSLVHDDLPAMDNDDYRRGRPSTHKQYGEAMGILAGDGLLGYAYEIASGTLLRPGAERRTGRALQLLARRPGIRGMLGGQVADVEMEQGKQPVDLERLGRMYEKKTGALLAAALEIGCVLAGGSEESRRELKEIGILAGLAFQVQDDILDVTGEEKKLGKPLHSDEKNQKTTYVTLLGLEEAGRQAEAMAAEAVKRMEHLEAENPSYDGFLSRLLAFLCYRDY